MKIFSKGYRQFTDEAVSVETVNYETDRYGMTHYYGFGGSYPFLRKPKPILAEYERRGYPFGKSIRGLKKFAKRTAL